jgi:hypothetical protein
VGRAGCEPIVRGGVARESPAGPLMALVTGSGKQGRGVFRVISDGRPDSIFH